MITAEIYTTENLFDQGVMALLYGLTVTHCVRKIVAVSVSFEIGMTGLHVLYSMLV